MLDTRRRGRRKGLAVRPGSVAQARRESGLTLAQVAGDKLSRAAIHLIETDKVKPSFETLELIAERTKKPLEFFLAEPDSVPQITAGHRELRELEQLTATRDFSKVIEIGGGLVDRPWSKANQAMLHFYLGQAHCRLCQPVPALEHLAEAHSVFEQLGDHWMLVEAMDWEAAAMGLLDDPRAITRALDALDLSRRLSPRSALTEARILGHIAAMFVAAHAWDRAMHYYQAALEAAGPVKDILQLAKAYHGLATVYQRMNQPARARQHFEKALALYAIESDLSAVFRVENDIGELLLRQGKFDAAEDHLRKALAGSDELGIDRKGRGYILANLGELALKKGNLAIAAGYLDEAQVAGETTDEQIVLANVALIRGELAERQHDREAADAEFQSAIGILERLAMPDRLRDGHIRYAELLEARGSAVAALAHWKAAAKLAAVGDPSVAAKGVEGLVG